MNECNAAPYDTSQPSPKTTIAVPHVLIDDDCAILQRVAVLATELKAHDCNAKEVAAFDGLGTVSLHVLSTFRYKLLGPEVAVRLRWNQCCLNRFRGDYKTVHDSSSGLATRPMCMLEARLEKLVKIYVSRLTN